MTIMEFAIARTWAQLKAKGSLDETEQRLLEELTLCVERYRAEEKRTA